MSPAVNGSSALRRFKRSDAIEIRDGITFGFYTALPHVYAHRFIHTVLASSQNGTYVYTLPLVYHNSNRRCLRIVAAASIRGKCTHMLTI